MYFLNYNQFICHSNAHDIITKIDRHCNMIVLYIFYKRYINLATFTQMTYIENFIIHIFTMHP